MKVSIRTQFVMWLVASVVAATALASQEAKESQPKTVAVTAAAAPAPTPAPGVLAAPVPVNVIYVKENQPVQIVDSHGRLLQVIYLKKSK